MEISKIIIGLLRLFIAIFFASSIVGSGNIEFLIESNQWERIGIIVALIMAVSFVLFHFLNSINNFKSEKPRYEALYWLSILVTPTWLIMGLNTILFENFGLYGSLKMTLLLLVLLFLTIKDFIFFKKRRKV